MDLITSAASTFNAERAQELRVALRVLKQTVPADQYEARALEVTKVLYS